jgi:hypothetical protein
MLASSAALVPGKSLLEILTRLRAAASPADDHI